MPISPESYRCEGIGHRDTSTPTPYSLASAPSQDLLSELFQLRQRRCF